MRHRLRLLRLTRSPRPGSQGMLDAPGAAVLIALAGVALQGAAGRGCAPNGAVALTPVAVAADQDLNATTCAEEESGRLIPHGHPRQAEGVLDGIVRGCNTGVAPVIDTV